MKFYNNFPTSSTSPFFRQIQLPQLLIIILSTTNLKQTRFKFNKTRLPKRQNSGQPPPPPRPQCQCQRCPDHDNKDNNVKAMKQGGKLYLPKVSAVQMKIAQG